jgi:hypothetical protein
VRTEALFLPDRKRLRHSRTEKGAQKGRATRPFRALDDFYKSGLTLLERMAGTTGLEPATSAVTGQRSNQLNYVPRA